MEREAGLRVGGWFGGEQQASYRAHGRSERALILATPGSQEGTSCRKEFGGVWRIAPRGLNLYRKSLRGHTHCGTRGWIGLPESPFQMMVNRQCNADDRVQAIGLVLPPGPRLSLP